MARLPPNIGMAFASSARRPGSSDSGADSRRRCVAVGAGDGAGEFLGALGDEAVVAAVDEDDADGGIGLREKAVGVGGFDLDHGIM